MVVLGISLKMMMKQKPMRKKTKIKTRGDKNSTLGVKNIEKDASRFNSLPQLQTTL